MALPNPSMSFSPFAILTAEEMNDLVENIEALSDSTGLDMAAVAASFIDGSIDGDKLTAASVPASKLDFTTLGVQTAYQSTTGTTTSTSFTATLSGTPGTNPSVTVTIGPSGTCLVQIGCRLFNGNGTNYAGMSFAASGDNTIAAGANGRQIGQVGTAVLDSSGVWILTGLNAGSTTFSARYRVDGNTGTFSERTLAVIPL